jgi:hypothetical protein
MRDAFNDIEDPKVRSELRFLAWALLGTLICLCVYELGTDRRLERIEDDLERIQRHEIAHRDTVSARLSRLEADDDQVADVKEADSAGGTPDA